MHVLDKGLGAENISRWRSNVSSLWVPLPMSAILSQVLYLPPTPRPPSLLAGVCRVGVGQ